VLKKSSAEASSGKIPHWDQTISMCPEMVVCLCFSSKANFYFWFSLISFSVYFSEWHYDYYIYFRFCSLNYVLQYSVWMPCWTRVAPVLRILYSFLLANIQPVRWLVSGLITLAGAGLLWEKNTVPWLISPGWNQQANRLIFWQW